MSLQDDYTPLIAGLVCVGVGAMLQHARSDRLSLPEPPDTGTAHRGRRKRAARRSRDAIAGFLPDNLLNAIGRTLMIAGAGMIAVRALDEYLDDEGAEY